MKNYFKYFHLFIAITGCTISLYAQNKTEVFAYKNEVLSPNPSLHVLTEQEKEGDFIKLKERLVLDYEYESSGNLVMYETTHVLLHINNDQGVEEMNKVYIPASSIIKQIDIQARTITPEGKVIPFDTSAIKRVDNLENSGPYIIFALSGVEKGSELEYIYTNKKTPIIYSYWKLQDKFLKKDVSVEIISPKNLIFEAKSYNGFANFVKDTTSIGQNRLMASTDKIDPIDDEKYSMGSANRMRFDLQLTYNLYKGKNRMYNYESAGVEFYNILFPFEKEDNKAISKLIKTLGLEKLKTDSLKLLTLEQWLKTHIGYQEAAPNAHLDKVLEVKYGNDLELQRLYVAAAQQLKIPVEVVLTSDRTKRKFDADFPSYNSLTDYLLYFPSVDKYLSAIDYSSRLGWPTATLVGSKGLFIKEVTIGDLKTGVSKVKPTQPTPYTFSHNNIDCIVEFDPETFTPNINFKQDFLGYCAYSLQPLLPYLDEEKKKKFLEEMSKFLGKETIVKSSKMTGATSDDVMVAPLVIESQIQAPTLVENAGAKLLFKIGELIGPQEEMYQEKKRTQDGEIPYAHSFKRTLKVNIPAGYKLSESKSNDLNGLKVEKKYDVDGKTVSVFRTDYTLNGSLLTVTVYEDYETLFYPLERYEEWRKIINASADFNKVVIVFEKM